MLFVSSVYSFQVRKCPSYTKTTVTKWDDLLGLVGDKCSQMRYHTNQDLSLQLLKQIRPKNKYNNYDKPVDDPCSKQGLSVIEEAVKKMKVTKFNIVVKNDAAIKKLPECYKQLLLQECTTDLISNINMLCKSKAEQVVAKKKPNKKGKK